MAFTTRSPFIWSNRIFCAILFALFIAILALRISYNVVATLDGAFSTLYDIYYGHHGNLDRLKRIEERLALTYNVLYMVLSMEVLGVSILTLVRSYNEEAARFVSLRRSHGPCAQIVDTP